MKKEVELRNQLLHKYMIYIVFVVYIVFLLKIVLFKTSSFIDILNGNLSAGYRSANLIPFKTIVDFFKLEGFSVLRIVSNTFGNIAIFMPMGYLMPIIFKRINKLNKVVILSFLVSIMFEILQYTFYLGTMDVDDVILNLLGGSIGYLVYFMVNKLACYDIQIYRFSFALSTMAFIIAYPIARYEFGNILGITSHETMFIGNENIPEAEQDLHGTYITINDNNLEMYNSIISKESQEKDFVERLDIKINENTKFYYTNAESLKDKTIVEYSPLNFDEVSKVDEYSIVSIWINKDNKNLADVVSFSNKINSAVSLFKSDQSIGKNEQNPVGKAEANNENINIYGDVVEIIENGIIINLATRQNLNDGRSISVIGRDNKVNYINVEFKDDTLFKIETEEQVEVDSSKNNIQIGNSVEIKGIKQDDKFIADGVVIFKETK